MAWHVTDVPPLQGATALVTGANSGIGLETATVLAARGARVLLGARDLVKGESAAAGIRARRADVDVEVVRIDLADLAQLEEAAGRVRELTGSLDLLINNGGVMAPPYRLTADGFELQIGTNHLGHFALTGHLLDLLLTAAAPRVVTVSSSAHRMASRVVLDDWASARGYHAWGSYGQSKLANLLFTAELGRRAEAAGLPLLATAAHPGYTATNLQAAGPAMRGSAVGTAIARVGNALVGQSARMGALPTLRAAVDPEAASGDYFGPRGLAESRGLPRRVGMSPAARDADGAAALWSASEAATGVHWTALRTD